MPLTGRPMLSTMDLQLVGRDGLADGVLDMVEQRRGILDPRADRRAHVQGDLAGVDGREEVRAQERQPAANDATTKAEEADDERPPMLERQGQDAAIDRRGPARSAARSRAGIEPADCARCLAARRGRATRMHELGVAACRAASADTSPSSGTRVRDSTNEAIIANTTASAIGTNRKPATPGRKNIGTKTMQMQQQRDEGRRHDLRRAVQDRGLARPCPAPGAS